jgi:hypothetical protein
MATNKLGEVDAAEAGLLGNTTQRPMMPVSEIDADVFGMSTNVMNQGLNEIDAGRQQAAAQQVVKTASELFRAGDKEGALLTLAKIKPDLLTDQVMNDLKVDRAVLQKRMEAEQVPTSETIKTDEGIIEVSGKLGSKQAKKLMGLTKPVNANEKPLSDKQLENITAAQASVDSVNGLKDLGIKLIEQNKLGPLTGRREQVLNALNLASPKSTEFQRTAEFLALGFAAQENRGRPTDKDQEAARQLITDMSNNPDAALGLLTKFKAAVEASQAGNLITTYDAATEAQRGPIERAIKSTGFNIQESRRLQELGRNTGLGDRNLRQGITLLKEFEKNPNLSAFKSKDIKDLMQRTLKVLKENQAEDLLD